MNATCVDAPAMAGVTMAGAGWTPDTGTTVVLNVKDCNEAHVELRRRGVRCDGPRSATTNMKCPNCGQEVTEQSLVKRARDIHSGIVLSNTQLFCPRCDAKVEYTAKSLFLGVGGFVVFVLCALVPLAAEVSLSGKIGLALFGALAAFASARYRIRLAELRLVANNEI